MSDIRDITLAPEGEKRIAWVKRNMPVLSAIEEDFKTTKPFKGVTVSVSVHLEAKTAYLARVFEAGGAEVHVTGSNPLSTQDAIAAALAAGGINVHAYHGATPEEYERHIRAVLAPGPNIIIDDGGDLVTMVHTEMTDLIPNIYGGCEETTTGITRLRAMENENILKFPMIAVNNAKCKHMFDNRYGTGQSVWDGIIRTTNLNVAGKVAVVAGYGWCGKGVAARAAGLGARVIVTEIDPVSALEALMDGYEVMSMDEAAKYGDFFVTVTSCAGAVAARHFDSLKDGAILTNAGHFDVEVDIAALDKYAVSKYEARTNIMGYVLPNNRHVFVLGEGRLVNLACGDGHPADIMDLSFAVQAMSAKYILDNKGKMPVKLLPFPADIDRDIAAKKLATLGVSIDTLSSEQEKYLNSWK